MKYNNFKYKILNVYYEIPYPYEWWNFDDEDDYIVNDPNEVLEKIDKLKIEGKVNVLIENDLPDN